MNGFLGTNATRSADLNLLIQLAMAAALTIGMILARRKRFRAHGWTQSTVLMLNLVAIASVMAPSFHRQVVLRPSGSWRDAYYAAPTIHAAFGTLAELLGLYVVLVATRLFPPALRFHNYKVWMRTTLAVWWVVVVLGVGTYYVWYVRPAPGVAQGTTTPAAPTAGTRVTLRNFSFDPGEVSVKAGTVVEWEDIRGRHQIVADDGSFQSDVLLTGSRFRHTFTKPGRYQYYCRFHGEPGGKDMAAVIVVK